MFRAGICNRPRSRPRPFVYALADDTLLAAALVSSPLWGQTSAAAGPVRSPRCIQPSLESLAARVSSAVVQIVSAGYGRSEAAEEGTGLLTISNPGRPEIGRFRGDSSGAGRRAHVRHARTRIRHPIFLELSRRESEFLADAARMTSNGKRMTSDEELLEAALHGDEAAFTALYQRRQGPVYRFALHMSGDAAV